MNVLYEIIQNFRKFPFFYFQEMEKKQEELKQIKKKKRLEIIDKIAELKQITGNSSLGIQDLDLDQEFDAKQHDEMMEVCSFLPFFLPIFSFTIFLLFQNLNKITVWVNFHSHF